MSADVGPDPYDDDGEPRGDDLRATQAEWGDAFLTLVRKLVGIRASELAASARSNDQTLLFFMSLLEILSRELERRARLYTEVAEVLADAVCPCCGRPVEGGDDAT